MEQENELTTMLSMEEFVNEYQSVSLRDAANLMAEIQTALEKEKKIKSDLQKKFDYLRLNKIPETMDEEGISNINFEGLGRVTLTSDVYANIPAAKKPDAFQWLKENGHGDLIQETVNSSTLKAFAKDKIKKGEDLPDNIFKITPFSRASITKSKERR